MIAKIFLKFPTPRLNEYNLFFDEKPNWRAIYAANVGKRQNKDVYACICFIDKGAEIVRCRVVDLSSKSDFRFF